jgi:quinolinate synthase
MATVENDIRDLKAKHGAVILAHYYEEGDIQDVADHIGDSLYLAQVGSQIKAPVVLMAGVVFMAESVKLLSPEKTVLVPDKGAGCSLVDHSPYEKYLAWRKAYPEAIVVTYVNSSAAVKSITDVCVTSSNAEKIIRAIPENRQILFGPDRNLGRYLSQKLGREMVLYPGSCQVHVLFSARKLFELKSQHLNALVLAHPECSEAVLQYADVIGSTSRLLDEVKNNHKVSEFIVATEDGIFHQMRKVRADAKLIQAPAEGSCACNQCPYMKMNSLEKIRAALTTLEPKVDIDQALAAKARVSLDRMMAITDGKKVTWPERFDG